MPHSTYSDMCRHERSKTTNSKGLAKQEDKSSPPTPSRHCQTTCQSVHKGGNWNNGVDSSPSCSLQYWFRTSDNHPFLLLKDALQGCQCADNSKLKHSMCEELWYFSSFKWQASLKGRISVLIVKMTYLKNYLDLVKDCKVKGLKNLP